MTMYRKKLKKNVKNEIMRNDAIIDIFEKFIKIAIDFDDKLYERVMKKRYQNSKRRINIYFKSSNEYRERRGFNKQVTTLDYRGIESMKLNFIQRSKRKNFKKKQKKN